MIRIFASFEAASLSGKKITQQNHVIKNIYKTHQKNHWYAFPPARYCTLESTLLLQPLQDTLIKLFLTSISLI
jgi:hypothetical protein